MRACRILHLTPIGGGTSGVGVAQLSLPWEILTCRSVSYYLIRNLIKKISSSPVSPLEIFLQMDPNCRVLATVRFAQLGTARY